MAGYNTGCKPNIIDWADRPDKIASAVIWLCSSAASFVIGAAIPVDGGFTAH
ncbi:Enoyl-(Acyl carrier protein) reductase [Chitinophaga sp. CF118]|uniref:SDR family oxidoreductase n=1 Tax=Chitinophaga sp. CF118 TaxID=1884367 RepID=UPI0008E51A68|nr:SDR family oxidoreductase [Chitinophaga sp. CF118]SFD08493.1 Enoyl-(Acyl carrier protein) reductase [Chitinophaga sp. CF118]